MPMAGSKQNQFEQLPDNTYVNTGHCFINISDSKPSQGPEKAQGQKMPFCEILWN